MENKKKLEKFFLEKNRINVQKGEIILRAEDEPKGIYYLKSGFVKMSVISEGGAELTLNIFKEGSYFPLLWAIGGYKNEYDYVALTEVEMYRVSKEKFIDFLRNESELMYELTQKIVVGLGGLVKRMEQLFFGNAGTRVASALVIAAKRFGKETKDGEIVIKLSLSHQDVASMAGLTRETTSLEMKKLEKAGLICYRRRYIAVLDMKGLLKEAGDDGADA